MKWMLLINNHNDVIGEIECQNDIAVDSDLIRIASMHGAIKYATLKQFENGFSWYATLVTAFEDSTYTKILVTSLTLHYHSKTGEVIFQVPVKLQEKVLDIIKECGLTLKRYQVIADNEEKYEN